MRLLQVLKLVPNTGMWSCLSVCWYVCLCVRECFVMFERFWQLVWYFSNIFWLWKFYEFLDFNIGISFLIFFFNDYSIKRVIHNIHTTAIAALLGDLSVHLKNKILLESFSNFNFWNLVSNFLFHCSFNVSFYRCCCWPFSSRQRNSIFSAKLSILHVSLDIRQLEIQQLDKRFKSNDNSSSPWV